MDASFEERVKQLVSAAHDAGVAEGKRLALVQVQSALGAGSAAFGGDVMEKPKKVRAPRVARSKTTEEPTKKPKKKWILTPARAAAQAANLALARATRMANIKAKKREAKQKAAKKTSKKK